MRRSIGGVMALAALLILAASARAQAPDSVMVGFDIDTEGRAVEHGTQVNETWAAWGIHLSHLPGTNASACGAGPELYAVSQCLGSGPMSAPNVISPCDGGGCPDFSEQDFGTIRVDFDREVEFVCIGVIPDHATDYGRLRLYDADGFLRGEIESPPGQTATICTPGEVVRRAEFTSPGNHFARFDNLTIRFVAVPVEPVTFGTVKALFR